MLSRVRGPGFVSSVVTCPGVGNWTRSGGCRCHDAGEAAVELAGDVVLEAPSNFTGGFAVGAVAGDIRSAGGDFGLSGGLDAAGVARAAAACECGQCRLGQLAGQAAVVVVVVA